MEDARENQFELFQDAPCRGRSQCGADATRVDPADPDGDANRSRDEFDRYIEARRIGSARNAKRIERLAENHAGKAGAPGDSPSLPARRSGRSGEDRAARTVIEDGSDGGGGFHRRRLTGARGRRTGADAYRSASVGMGERGHLSRLALGFAVAIRDDPAPEKPEFQSDRLVWRAVYSVVDRLFTIVQHVAMSPTEARNIVLDPLANIEAVAACPELIDTALPLADDVLVPFARQDRPAALLATILLAGIWRGFPPELGGGVVIAEAVHHRASVSA